MLTSREIALRLLVLVETKRVKADEALDDLLDRVNLQPKEKALAFELAYGVLRWQGRLDFTLGRISKYPLLELTPWIRNVLRLGAYQILFLTRIPSWAAIAEAVRLARRFGHRGTASLVNGVLREIEKKKEEFNQPLEPLNDILALSRWYAHPEWLVQRWVKRFGTDLTRRILEANNRLPPLTVRVNNLKISRRDFLLLLEKKGIEAWPCRMAWEGVTVKGKARQIKPFLGKGFCVIQDEASMLVSYVAQPLPGMVVLDTCAAPGGKTTHLAQIMGDEGVVWAMDSHPDRLRILEENLKPLEFQSIRVSRHDARLPMEFEMMADLVLLDAPCSGLGVLRRHPEIKWLKEERDLIRLAEMQLEIMENVCRYVKRQGRLVYSVCSFEQEETSVVIGNFLKEHPDYHVVDPTGYLPDEARQLVTPDGYFQILPGQLDQVDMDGFFIACLARE